MTLPTKVPSDSLGGIGSLQRTSDKFLFPMALGSCGHRITHQLRPINMNGRSILSVTSTLARQTRHGKPPCFDRMRQRSMHDTGQSTRVAGPIARVTLIQHALTYPTARSCVRHRRLLAGRGAIESLWPPRFDCLTNTKSGKFARSCSTDCVDWAR